MNSLFNYYDNDDKRYDRTWRNEDGTTFYGRDDGYGKTDWYDSYGNIDSVTDTPDDMEQAMNDEGYWFYD